MADLEKLKQKYANVLDLIKRSNVRLDHLHVEGDKLVMKGAAPNQDVKNEVWNAIKAADASFSDLAADISIDSTLPSPATSAAPTEQTYSVQPGDTLSKIARQFYGDAGQYMKIFEANKDKLKDPNQIQVGQELNIPV